MRGDGLGQKLSFVAPVARAAVCGKVGGKHLAVRLFRRDAEAVVRASDGREVDRRDELAPFPVAPDEDDDVVVVVVGDEPLKALPRKSMSQSGLCDR